MRCTRLCRSGGDPRVVVAPLHRNRDYLSLWGGGTVSAIGSQVTGLALPLLVLALTGSPAQMGIVGALEGIPYILLSLPAGAAVDRWNRRGVMVACDIGRAVNLTTIPLALALGHLTVLQIYLVGLIEGMLFVPFDIAQVAALTRLVPREQMAEATAQGQATWGISALAGPPLGGLLYGMARAIPFVVDAVSYVLSALSILSIRAPLSGERAREGSLWGGMTEGMRWLWRHPGVRFVAAFSAAGDFVFSGADLVLIVLARRVMHASPLEVGLVFSVAAVGGIAGALVAPRVQSRLRFAPAVIGTSWAIALLYFLFAVAPVPLALGAVWAGIAVMVAISNTVRLSYQRIAVPDALQGRVAGVTNLAAHGSLPLGQALTGVALQLLGPRPTVLAIGACNIGLAIAASASRDVRRVQVEGGDGDG